MDRNGPRKREIDRDFAIGLETHLALHSGLPEPEVVSRIATALNATDNWLSRLDGGTSLFNARMFFCEQLSESFPGVSVRDDSRIADILLAGTGTRSPGDEFDQPRLDGGTDHWRVLSRRIGPRFGIELAMQNQDGKIVQGEFFD